MLSLSSRRTHQGGRNTGRERETNSFSKISKRNWGRENPVTTKPENLGLLQEGVLQDDLGGKPKLRSE